MNIKNQIISTLNCAIETNKKIIIVDSIINILNLGFAEYKDNVYIKNCLINQLIIHTSWFKRGILIENCIIKDKINYEMGGHNEHPIIIRENVCCDLFIFFDCQFTDKLIIENNIFLKGSTILGNLMNNIFMSNTKIKNNIGNIYLNQIE